MRRLIIGLILMLLGLVALAACDIFVRSTDTPDVTIVQNKEPDVVVVEDKTPDVVVIEDKTADPPPDVNINVDTTK